MEKSKWGVSSDEARELMERYLEAENMRSHSIATQAIMTALAPRFGEDPELWGIIGLLHDLDYDATRETMQRHTLVTEEILREKGLSPEVYVPIKYHNAENLGLTREKPVHFALTAAETITGMIVAAALVNPDKKIASVKPKSVIKRMKAKEFARSVNRDHIKLCEKIDIPLEEFIVISLEAMGRVSDRLGL
jgi:uncharacterized protein